MNLLDPNMTVGFDPDSPDGIAPSYVSPSTIVQHQTPDVRMFGPRPVNYRYSDLLNNGSTPGVSTDPAVTTPTRMGDLSAEDTGLAPRRTFGQRVRDFVGGTGEYASDQADEDDGQREKQETGQELGEQYARPDASQELQYPPESIYAPQESNYAPTPAPPIGTHTQHLTSGGIVRKPGTKSMGTIYSLWGE